MKLEGTWVTEEKAKIGSIPVSSDSLGEGPSLQWTKGGDGGG